MASGNVNTGFVYTQDQYGQQIVTGGPMYAPPQHPVEAGKGHVMSGYSSSRPPAQSCKTLRSYAISCIVQGVLLIVFYSVILWRTSGLAVLIPGTSIIAITKGAAIWGGLVAVMGGAVALFGDSQIKKIGPLSKVSVFTTVAICQLIGAIITTAAAAEATSVFHLFFLAPILSIDASSAVFVNFASDVNFWMAFFVWVFSWGPPATLLWTFRFTMTAVLDVISL